MTEEQRQETNEAVEDQAPADVEGAEEIESGSSAEEGVAEEVDELAALRQELEESRAKEAEYLDGWQRARAELANARKRFQREQEQAYANAKADLLVRLLPIVDDFDRACEMVPDNPSSTTWIEGVNLVHQKFLAFLKQEGVVPIEAASQEFDPYFHQAVTHEPSAEVPDGHVIAVVQKGYKVGERVLRPSIVRVSSGPPPEPEPDIESEETGENQESEDQS